MGDTDKRVCNLPSNFCTHRWSVAIREQGKVLSRVTLHKRMSGSHDDRDASGASGHKPGCTRVPHERAVRPYRDRDFLFTTGERGLHTMGSITIRDRDTDSCKPMIIGP